METENVDNAVDEITEYPRSINGKLISISQCYF